MRRCRRVIFVGANDGHVSTRVEYCYEIDKGEITGLPVGVQQITEAKNFTYDIRLSIVPTANVQLSLNAISSNVNYNCQIWPSSFAFPMSTAITTSTQIQITTQGNLIDEGTDAVTYSCQIEHTVMSTDPQYAKHPISIVDINIINDDQADVKLWTINSETNTYDYDVKFVGPLSTNEGGSIAYGVRLDTEPQFPVTIYPNISLNDATNIQFHPILNANPPTLIFGKSNWSTIQRLQLVSTQDNVDNDNERFQILHQVITSDQILYTKSLVKK